MSVHSSSRNLIIGASRQEFRIYDNAPIRSSDEEKCVTVNKTNNVAYLDGKDIQFSYINTVS